MGKKKNLKIIVALEKFYLKKKEILFEFLNKKLLSSKAQSSMYSNEIAFLYETKCDNISKQSNKPLKDGFGF